MDMMSLLMVDRAAGRIPITLFSVFDFICARARGVSGSKALLHLVRPLACIRQREPYLHPVPHTASLGRPNISP